MDNCGYHCVNFILFLENYVQCKEIICYFSLKSVERGGGGGGGRWGVGNKMEGLTYNKKIINWGGRY